MKEALIILGELVHQLQRERGCAAVFLGSEGRLFQTRLQHQFEATEQTYQSFQEASHRWQQHNTLKSSQQSAVNRLFDLRSELTNTRQAITDRELKPLQAIGFYSHELISPAMQCMVEIALLVPGNDPARVSAFSNFQQWKERVALERAIGARGFLGYTFHNREFLERVLFLLSEQESFQRTFLALASPEQRQALEQAFDDESNTTLEKIHDALKHSPESELLHALTPEEWFDLVTHKIDAMKKVEHQLTDTLSRPANIHEQAPPDGGGTPAILPGYRDFLHSLPIFAGVPAKDLDTLLSQGQVREFPKGKLLFLQDEQPNRLYIILKGWVKIFKGTAAGEETILQMLSSGDSVMESAVFLNTPFPVSAQIVENATVLSLPAPIIREQIRNNNELAMNLLASMSHRSQSLIRQIEHARLKSVDERIGWFLLKLLLEQGRLSREVELPYDKSLIASHLDMKRETFSRALNRLKNKGFRIENNMVVLPTLDSLCAFCDTSTAQECALHGTERCPNPQCDEAATPDDHQPSVATVSERRSQKTG